MIKKLIMSACLLLIISKVSSEESLAPSKSSICFTNQEQIIKKLKVVKVAKCINNNRAMVYTSDGNEPLVGIINADGEFILPTKYNFIETDDFSEGLGILWDKKDEFGYINENYEVIIEPQYIEPGSFHKGIAVVRSGENYLYGAIDKYNKTVIHFMYDYLSRFYDGFAIAALNKDGQIKYGVIDTNGNVIVPFIYEDSSNILRNGLLPVKKDGKWGLINTENKLLIPFEYQMIDLVKNEYMAAEKDGMWGIIDTNNNTIIPFEYEGASSFSEGVVGVKKNGKWGFVNADNHVTIPFIYSMISTHGFEDGTIYVKKENKELFIDHDGNSVPGVLKAGIYRMSK